MTSRRTLLAIIFALSVLTPLTAATRDEDPAVPAVLAAAESLFQAMRDRDYQAVFACLSARSRETIVAETVHSIAAAEGKAPATEVVARDFETAGPIAKEYWTAYLLRFDPNDALERSRWEMGKMEKDRAEVLITWHRAETPAVLRMYREGGNWKVGLVETFWTR